MHTTNSEKLLSRSASSSRSNSTQSSVGALLSILGGFVLLAIGITLISHLFGQYYLRGDEFTGEQSQWGSASDWFSGVMGVSIGLAGSAIAIWLAYRVEKLTVAQNQLANAQAWRETYIESGDITARAELAAHAYEVIQRLYFNLIEIEKIDKELDRTTEPLEEEQERGTAGADVTAKIEKEYAQARQAAAPYRAQTLSAVSEMIAMLPQLHQRDMNTDVVVGISSKDLLDFANECMYANDFGSDHKHQIAEQILRKNDTNIHVSDAVQLLMFYTQTSPLRLGYAAYQSTDHYPESLFEFYWQNATSSVGQALKRFSNYLPAAHYENDNARISISWVAAYCDFVIDQVNPYSYAHDAIKNDLLIGDVTPQQEQRLTMLSHLAINKILPLDPYTRELFSDSGYMSLAKSEYSKESVEQPAVKRQKGILEINSKRTNGLKKT